MLGTAGLALWALAFHRDVFKVDRRGLWLMGGLGGAMVALFEVAYQFGIAGAGVAGAAALLYTAPVMVALLARPILGERLTPLRMALAIAVMTGAALTVTGGRQSANLGDVALPGLVQGVLGGLLAAASYAGTTLLARFAVPRYGILKVLFLELLGGTVILGMLLPLLGYPPALPPSTEAWLYTIG